MAKSFVKDSNNINNKVENYMDIYKPKIII